MKFRTLNTHLEPNSSLNRFPLALMDANGLHIYVSILCFPGFLLFIIMNAPFDSRPNRTNKLICTTNLSKHLGNSPSSTPSYGPWMWVWMRLLYQEGVCGDSLGNTYLRAWQKPNQAHWTRKRTN